MTRRQSTVVTGDLNTRPLAEPALGPVVDRVPFHPQDHDGPGVCPRGRDVFVQPGVHVCLQDPGERGYPGVDRDRVQAHQFVVVVGPDIRAVGIRAGELQLDPLTARRLQVDGEARVSVALQPVVLDAVSGGAVLDPDVQFVALGEEG